MIIIYYNHCKHYKYQDDFEIVTSSYFMSLFLKSAGGFWDSWKRPQFFWGIISDFDDCKSRYAFFMIIIVSQISQISQHSRFFFRLQSISFHKYLHILNYILQIPAPAIHDSRIPSFKSIWGMSIEEQCRGGLRHLPEVPETHLQTRAWALTMSSAVQTAALALGDSGSSTIVKIT